MKYALIVLGGLILLVVAALVTLRICAQWATGARIRITIPNGIDSSEKIQLGGVEQWIQIRGHDRAKPILLFLHGGPGFPQMPFSHLNAELEKDFVVVQWDQRGAGKSYSWSIPDESMHIEQFVSDTHDLVQFLLQRFGAPKCYLVAHSWGSVFGALTIARYPELFYAYVGIGQVAGVPETQQVRYQFALDAARKETNKKALTELERIGRPPHADVDTCMIMEKWVDHYARQQHRSVRPSEMAWLAFESPAYSWIDLGRIPFGVRYSFEALWRELFYKIDLFQQAPRLEVPLYFFLGRYDEVVTTKVTERYFNTLDAPRGKRLIWFEHSGHFPHFEASQKYRELMVNTVRKETYP